MKKKKKDSIPISFEHICDEISFIDVFIWKGTWLVLCNHAQKGGNTVWVCFNYNLIAVGT